MNISNRKEMGNREFFLLSVSLLGMCFVLPNISWLFGIGLLGTIIAWLCHNADGFLSVVWRIVLVLVLVASVCTIGSTFITPEAIAARPQLLGVGVIGFGLSAFGFVRSLLIAHSQIVR